MKKSMASQVASVLAAAVTTLVTFQSIATYALPAARVELVTAAATCRATSANATRAAPPNGVPCAAIAR